MQKLSRTKIELFVNCPRCFYLDQKLGVKRPPIPGFSLNSAVDHLLKKEFDIHRALGEQHPLQKAYGIDARPVHHEMIDQWRENFVGVQFHHERTDFLVFGAIDDIWLNGRKEYMVVDYKSTSRAGKVTELGVEKWYQSYRRQMEVYQWLLRHNGLKVSDTGYFVYCNGIKDRKAFDAKLEFDLTLIPYRGSDAWIEQTILKIKKCLGSNKIPTSGADCEYCKYRDKALEVSNGK